MNELHRERRVYHVQLGVIADGGAPDPVLAPDDVILVRERTF